MFQIHSSGSKSPPVINLMPPANFLRILKKRDLWTTRVFRLGSPENLFSNGAYSLVKQFGETGLRASRNYQSVVADPFLFVHGERLYLFYEVKTDHGHGTIHAQSMSNDGHWQAHGQVLAEPFHLSYPQVFSYEGRVFMMPESAQSGAVRLYEAENFPFSWRACGCLIEAPLRDPTLLITQENGLFLFSTTAQYELKLHHAEKLDTRFKDTGLFITQDPVVARCAGGILRVGNKILRPAQDCSETYGKQIIFQEIEYISTTGYRERPSGLKINITEEPWMSRGSHHISCVQFFDSFYVALDGRSHDQVLNSLTLAFLRISEKIGLCKEATRR